MNCQFGVGGTPALLAGGTVLTFVSGGGVLADGIDGLPIGTVLSPSGSAVSDAVWSAGGKLAVVRGGRVWAGAPGKLRLLGAGSSPSWSPDGKRLAIARRGWVVIVGLSGGRARRLVHGGAPAFSPDGRWVAFIGAHHRLRIIAARGGRVRPVGRVSGVAVDWQPIPRKPPARCAAPLGSKVIASSSQAVVTTRSVPGSLPEPEPDEAAMGCLFADGRERLLEKFTDNTVDNAVSVAMAVVAAPYAALVTSENDYHYDTGFSQSTSVFDLRTGKQYGHGGASVDCPASPTCTVGIDHLVLGGDGVSAVHVQGGPLGEDSDAITALACASTSLCIAASDSDSARILSSPTPLAAPWQSGSIQGQGLSHRGMSCPSVSLCVATAVNAGNSTIYTSTSPASGASSWTATQLPSMPNLGPISCPTTTLCVASGGNFPGEVAVSTNPTGGTAAWSIYQIDGSSSLENISCPSATECVATDIAGNVLSTSNPTGGPGTWNITRLSSQPQVLGSISCPSTSLCVALQQANGVNTNNGTWVSSAPTSGQWTLLPFPNDSDAISCPSTSLCVAASVDTIDVSTDPTSGSWTSYPVPGVYPGQTQVSCPSTTFCVAPGGNGQVLVSTNPTGGPNAWTPVLADQISCSNTPSLCGTEKIIASDRTGVHTLDTSTEFEAQTGPQLTGLTLTGDTLTWQHSGASRTTTLRP